MKGKKIGSERTNKKQINLITPTESGEFVEIMVNGKRICEVWVSEYHDDLGADITLFPNEDIGEVTFFNAKSWDISKGACIGGKYNQWFRLSKIKES